jgi:hypothetical protein
MMRAGMARAIIILLFQVCFSEPLRSFQMLQLRSASLWRRAGVDCSQSAEHAREQPRAHEHRASRDVTMSVRIFIHDRSRLFLPVTTYRSEGSPRSALRCFLRPPSEMAPNRTD